MQHQPVTKKVAYHWQIGRETTAAIQQAEQLGIAYHWQIGRETTANINPMSATV